MNEAYSTIVYRPGKPGARPPAFDIQGIATHELGHALGLDHSEVLDATMYPSLRGNGLSLRTLHRDDPEGVEFLYGLRTQEEPSVAIIGVQPPLGRPGPAELAISNSLGSAGLSEAYLYVESPPLPFVRGDADGDGEVRLTDAIVLLGYLFRGAAARDCDDARDANDDGSVDLSDAVTVLRYLFDPRVASLPAPFLGSGLDPTEDELGCAE